MSNIFLRTGILPLFFLKTLGEQKGFLFGFLMRQTHPRAGAPLLFSRLWRMFLVDCSVSGTSGCSNESPPLRQHPRA